MEPTKAGVTQYQIQVQQRVGGWGSTHFMFDKITDATRKFDELIEGWASSDKDIAVPIRIIQTTSAIVAEWEPEKETA